jgi:hypothetical protein
MCYGIYNIGYNQYMEKKRDKRFRDNPRNIMLTLRVNKQEYEAIKKRYGGLAGLRNYVLQGVEAERAVEGSDKSLN